MHIFLGSDGDSHEIADLVSIEVSNQDPSFLESQVDRSSRNPVFAGKHEVRFGREHGPAELSKV